MSWDPYTASAIGSPSKGGATHRQKSAFASTRPARDVLGIKRVLGHPPYGICAFVTGHGLGSIGFDEGNATGFAYLTDELRMDLSS